MSNTGNLASRDPSIDRAVIAENGRSTLRLAKIRFRNDGDLDFFRAVSARVNAYFTETGQSRFADWRLWIKGALFLGIAAGCYCIILLDRLPVLPTLCFGILFSLSVLFLGLNVAHDAAHNALTTNRGLNRGIQVALFVLMGASAYLWQLRHNKSHHVFPNVNGCDIDIDSNVFVRLSPNHPRRFYHRFQHIYAPMIFWLVDVDTVFNKDFQYLFTRNLANMRDIRHAPSEYFMFAATKLIYIGIAFVIPTLATRFGLVEVVLGNLIMSFVASVVFVLLLIGTHFNEMTKFPTVDEGGRLPGNWATHALATSLDWAPLNPVAHFFVGGSNAHAAHHLFPSVCHVHYRPITQIIQDEAARRGLRYNQAGLLGMIGSHFRYLRRIGRAPMPHESVPKSVQRQADCTQVTSPAAL
jgi:linoleoyl-CoA desaturase